MTCRLTHAYPDGAAPYFTVLAPVRRGAEAERWGAIKAAAADAVIAAGGTITHHHAVGRDHRPWYDRQRPEPFATRAARRQGGARPARPAQPRGTLRRSMSSASAKNMQAVCQAKEVHDKTCPWGGKGTEVHMAWFDIERMGWEEGDVICGLVVVGDETVATGMMRVTCDAEGDGGGRSEEEEVEIVEAVSDRELVPTTPSMRLVRLRSGGGELEAAFAPEAGLVGCSLTHRGEELLAQRKGLEEYARSGSTFGIPFLHPWANRLAGFSYAVGGHEVELDRDSELLRLEEHGLPDPRPARRTGCSGRSRSAPTR